MKRFTFNTVIVTVMFLLSFQVSGWSQVNIIPTRTDVAGFATWTDVDVTGTTYLQLLKATSSTTTPAMNFDVFTNETLNFKARTFGGINAAENEVTVWISTDNGGSWTSLGTRTPTSTALTAVTPFDLSAYSGTQVKVKFTTAGTSNTVGAGIDDLAITGISSAAPSITVSATSLTGFLYVTGNGPSAEQSFTVSGSDLTSTIEITAPTDYEISLTSGGTFGGSLTLTPSGTSVPATSIFVRLKAGLGIGSYNGEIISLTSTGATPVSVTCDGSVIAPPPQIDWANLQWPPSGTIALGDGYTVYAQVYEPGVTDAAGQGAGLNCWIGYSTTNTDPSTWTNWIPATFNTDAGNNDEFQTNLGAAILATGTYYYASKFQLGIADPVYGGFSGGFWNGTSNVSGVLTVAAGQQINWANLQWPPSGTINTGGAYNVYAQVYEPGITDATGQGAGISCWIGYNNSDTDPSTWTNWVPAVFNTDAGNNDEYTVNLGAAINQPGVYYYASRFKLGLSDYVYGGFSSGFWDGTSNVSGVLTINIPSVMINEVDSDTPGTDAAEFIELYDGGVGNSLLSGLVVVLFNGNNDLSYAAYDLDGYSTNASGYFTLGNAAVPGVDLVFTGNFLQNGQDAVALYADNATSFPTNTPVTITNLVDAFVYDTDDADDPGLLVLLNAGQPQVNENGRGRGDTYSSQRIPNGTGGLRNTSSYDQTLPTPDGPNAYLELTWTGATSSDWALNTNWSPNYIPDAVSNVTIPDMANDPVISAATASCRNLNIAPTAKLELSVTGKLTVAGTTNNSAGASGLIIKSDASGTGSLIQNTPGVAATAERYINAWGDALHGWHFLSSPVAGQLIQPEFVENPPAAHTDFYSWDENSNTWINTKANNGTWNPAFESTFTTGKGYLVAYQNTVTKNFSGNLNVTDVPVTGITNNLSSDNHGWNLLGNPFSSALKWNDGNWSLSTGIAGTAKIWDEASASYIDIAANGTIPAMNGFMVQLEDPNTTGTLTIPAVSRIHSSQNWYKSGEGIILLTAADLENNTAQQSIISMNELATDAYDSPYDSRFLPGYAPKFFSLVDTKSLSTNTLPDLSDARSVEMGFEKTNSSSYSISLSLEKMYPNLKVYLTDKKENQVVDLTVNPTYAFSAADGDDINRFRIHFKDATSVPENNAIASVRVYSLHGQIHIQSEMNISGKVTVTDLSGRTVAGRQMSQENNCMINMNGKQGIFLVSIASADGTFVQKVALQ